MQIEELAAALNKGEVNFKFIKKDGSTRIAKGTRNLGSIPESQHPKGGVASSLVLPFFDLDAQGWRSLSIDSKFEIC